MYALKRVAVYYRVSTDKQDFESQKFAIENWLAVHKPKTVYTFEDYALSGVNPNRPGLKKMLGFAQKRKIDAIVAFKLDRISRDSKNAMQILLTLEQLAVEIIFVDQPLFSTPDNPFNLIILAVFAQLAEMERNNIRSRIKNGIAVAKAKGVKFGQPIKVTQEKIIEIINLRKSGLTIREISELTKLSIGSICRAIKNSTKKIVA